LNGKGVKKDSKEALQYFLKSAEAECANSYYRIGTMYEEGRAGLKKDKEEALSWYAKSAEKGLL